jgi:GAF domain-containing protein
LREDVRYVCTPHPPIMMPGNIRGLVHPPRRLVCREMVGNKLHIVAALLRLPKASAILSELAIIYRRPSEAWQQDGKRLKKLGSAERRGGSDSRHKKVLPDVPLSLVFHLGVGFALEWRNTPLEAGLRVVGRLPQMADEISSDKKGKPVFDEQTLAKLLEAAYVLQEHNRELQKMELREASPRREESRPEEPRPEELRNDERREGIHLLEPAATMPPSAAPAGVPANNDYTAILGQIVETQHQIQVRQLALDPALAEIVKRIVEITRAAGASIGILEARNLHYRAAFGRLALPVGTEVLLEKALCAASLRVGDVIRCADVNPEFLIDGAECQRRGIQSLICVPVYHDGQTAGGLEVYFAAPHAFSEPDVHSCQLMAGLVTEALARNQEQTSKHSLAAERAVMLEALEKLKPNLAALVDSTAAKVSAAPAVASAAAAPATQTIFCRKCGHELVSEEQFCGECGTPRRGEYETPSMQSKVASMLSMQDSVKKNANGSGANGSSTDLDMAGNLNPSHSPRTLADSAENEFPELFRLPDLTTQTSEEAAEPDLVAAKLGAETHPLDLILRAQEEKEESEELENAEEELGSEAEAETALVKQPSTPWTSAAAAREFLERLAGRTPTESGALARFLRSRRGDVYLALAVLLAAIAIRWGIWSNHSVSATGNPGAASASHRPSDADLPFFDRVLIKLGLADAPDAPEDKGNPDIQVWIDLRTALYYCPGTDLYGKSPKGKFETQRDAQLDNFEPANRKACN